jgi:hypothetical protein
MNKISKIIGQLANQGTIEIALRQLDRVLEGQDKVNAHIAACYSQFPQARSANEVLQELSANRVEAITKINNELSGTKFSWDYLSDCNINGPDRISFEAAFENTYSAFADIFKASGSSQSPAQKSAPVKTVDLGKITRNTVVLAKASIIDKRMTKDGKEYLVVFLDSRDPEEKIIGAAIIFDDKTMAAVKANHEEIMFKVIPAKASGQLPIARIYS